MEAQTSKSPHTLYWIAGIAVTVFSAVGIAAIMGWIPSSISSPADKVAVVEQPAVPAKPAAATVPASADQSHEQAREKARERAEEDARVHARDAARARAQAPAQVADSTPARWRCAECGVVQSVREIETKGEGTGLGAVGGAVVGGLLGHQVGNGRGQDVATVIGAVGGVVAGNEIEKRVKSGKSYEITVRLEDGSSRVISEASVPTWRSGDRVKIINGAIQSNA